jgi:formyl-CoA transferase
LDIALLDVQVAMLANLNMNYLVSGKVPQRMGNAHQNIVPYQTFATADGHIIVAAGNDQQFDNLCKLVNRPDLSVDVRFARNSARVAHRVILVPLLETIFLGKTSAWWLEALEAIGIPCGPINSLAEVWQNPQVVERCMRVDLDHQVAGSVANVASPLRLSRTPVSYRSAPPLLGADTKSVLSELLGWGPAELAALKEEIK